MTTEVKIKNPHAQALGRLGGRATADRMTPEARQERSRKAGALAPGWPKGKPRGSRPDSSALASQASKAGWAKLSPEERSLRAAKGGRKAPGWPKGKPRGPRPKTPFAIIYGAEGADFPRVAEDGPYRTLSEARAGIDREVAEKVGGWMIVSQWEASDGESITTGKGQVVEGSK